MKPNNYMNTPVSMVEPAIPGSERWNQLTWAISAWRKASLATSQNMATCENAAQELEIERDTGKIVHINKRTG